MNIKELNVIRQEKVDAITDIVETRGSEMTEDSLSVVEGFKAEITEIDNKIKGQELMRSVALTNAKPATKQVIKEDTMKVEFRNFLTGEISKREFEKRTGTVAVNGVNVVPEVFLKELNEKILERGNLYSATKKLTTADNGEILIPTIDDTANAGAWLGEGDTIAKADFTTGKLALNAYKLATGISVSRELLEDAFFNVESYIAKSFGERLARTIEIGILDGTGTGQMTGLLDAAGTQTYTSATAGVVTIEDIEKAIYKLSSSQRQGAVIYVSDDAFMNLSLEVDSTGRKLLQTAAGATAADPVKSYIAGYEVQVQEGLAAVANGSESVFIGDMSKYVIRNVSGFRITRDDFSAMAADEVNFYCTMRLDGKVLSVNDSFVKIVTSSV